MFTNIKYYINHVLIEAQRAEICVIHSNAKSLYFLQFQLWILQIR